MTDFARRMLRWYTRHKRDLPWRDHPDPYAVWVSEIMLQQTQVATVIPFFERWMNRFPGIAELAAASEEDVLRLWEGLGYYSRARNLHRAARIVAAEHGGRLPGEAAELRRLPGIGRYTAGAIASMAFGRDEALLDGNLKRVLARAFDVRTPADTPDGERALWALAESHLPAGRAGDFNQALMDLGATVCLPRAPRCPGCPVRGICIAFRRGVQEQRPVTAPRRAVPERVKAAAVIVRGGKVLLARRPAKGLLGGLWEFPSGEVRGDPARGLVAAIRAGYGLRVRRTGELGVIRHGYTHFKLHEHVYVCRLEAGSLRDDFAWVAASRLADFPMGRVDRQIAARFEASED